MKERNPNAVCDKCPYFMRFSETSRANGAIGGECRNRYEEATSGRPGGYQHVMDQRLEFCPDHPDWKLLEGSDK